MPAGERDPASPPPESGELFKLGSAGLFCALFMAVALAAAAVVLAYLIVNDA